MKHVVDVADLAADLGRVPTAKDVAKAAKATERAANRRKAAAKAAKHNAGPCAMQRARGSLCSMSTCAPSCVDFFRLVPVPFEFDSWPT